MPLDRARFTAPADFFAAALAASLPWSTSATGIIAVLWLLTAIPTFDLPSLRRVCLTPAGYLPLILVGLGAVGMLWAGVSWAERFDGLSSFLKLLFIPLLLCHFRRSERSHHVLIAFLASTFLLLLASWCLFVWPSLRLFSAPKGMGIPVKDYISQGAMFTVSIFILSYFSFEYWRDNRRLLSLLLIALILVFVANIFYIATSRTSLVVLPILLIVFGFRLFGWKGAIGLFIGFLILIAVAWPSANYLRTRVTTLFQEVATHRPTGEATPAGERLEFWKKSIESIKASPVFGHGTGSIPDQFRRAAAGQTGMAGEASVNPHNQFFAIGVQLGFFGIIVLLAMWIAHLALFRFKGFAAWAGLVIVIQNIVGSMFNSHLFDFTHGWVYVVGVGVAGGIALRASSGRRIAGGAPRSLPERRVR
jgi:O-antigen ligase